MKAFEHDKKCDNLQLVIIEQDALRIENCQTHSIVRFIRGNSGNCWDRISLIIEITLECYVLRNNSCDDFF
jgi:hypothetical protein